MSRFFSKKFIFKVFDECNRDNVFQLAAAVAFYMVFSLAPLLLIAITIGGIVYGEAATSQEVFVQLQDMFGAESATAIQGMIESIRAPASSFFATFTAVVIILIGASTVFRQLKISLDFVWNVPYEESTSWMLWFQKQLLAFLMVFGIGILLVAFVFITTLATAFGDFLNSMFPILGPLLIFADSLVFFFIFTLLFAIIFKFLPDIEIEWSDVWVGSALTAFLFTLGKFLIALYLGWSSTASVYGAAGSFVVILLWIYYSAQIFFLGAEFTQVYTTTYGSMAKKDTKIIPEMSGASKVALGVASAITVGSLIGSYFFFRKKKKTPKKLSWKFWE